LAFLDGFPGHPVGVQARLPGRQAVCVQYCLLHQLGQAVCVEIAGARWELSAGSGGAARGLGVNEAPARLV
jgi:hypothetical protein